jgi:uncharacterized protein YjiS (DUF1127 family)
VASEAKEIADMVQWRSLNAGVTRAALDDEAGRDESCRAIARAIGARLYRPFERAAVTAELEGLNDRQLADIGVAREDIPLIAGSKGDASSPTLAALAWALVRSAGRAIAGWRSRRAAIRELMALDDRMLRDIGIARSDIAAMVAGMARGLGAVAPISRPETGIEVATISSYLRGRAVLGRVATTSDRGHTPKAA